MKVLFEYKHTFTENSNVNALKQENFKHKLEKEKLDELVKFSNRSEGQTQFLFNLVDGNFDKLKLLETKIKEKHLCYCPGDKEEVKLILA